MPHSPLYVVKGETARLVWTYNVDNKNSEFDPLSPVWFYMENQIRHEIGHDNGYIGWTFQTATYSCPPRLISPTVRVSRQDQATLVIQNTTMNDTGIYGCRLSLRSGSGIMSTVELVATETPTFVVKLDAITAVVEDSDLQLTCTAVGTPTPNVTCVHSATKATIAQGENRAVLYLSNVKRSLDGNRYQCQAINNPNHGPVTITTTVVVYCQQSCTCGQDGGTAGVAVSATFLVISLMANILFELYIYRTKRKTREPTEQGYDTKTVQMDSVTSSVTMAQSSHPSVVYEPVEMDHSEQARQKQPTSPRKPAAVPNNRTIPKQPTIYANTIPENDLPSQDHYQKLNPATLQHDPTVQYEPLRIKHVTGTDLRNDTYEPLRNRPSKYQSLQKPSNVNNTSFS